MSDPTFSNCTDISVFQEDEDEKLAAVIHNFVP